MKIQDIVQQWENTNLLEGFDDKISIATCLQAQFKMNEVEHNPQFKRISIPLVVRMLSESKAAQRNYFHNFFENTKPLWASLNTVFKDFHTENLEEEADQTAVLAAKLTKEIDALFADTKNKDIVFHGLHCLNNGNIMLAYS